MIDRKIATLAGIVYFIQGALGISAIALPLFLRSAGYSIKEIAIISAIASSPWFIKIIYGAISDSHPIFGLRRKPYIVLFSFLSFLGWIMLAVCPPRFYYLIFSMLLANLGFAATDVVTDGIIVERSDEHTTQVYQSICWGFRSFGAVVTGFLGGYLAARWDYRFVFFLTSLLPLASLATAFFIDDHKVTVKENVIRPIIDSLKFLVKNDLKYFALIVLLGAFSASFSTPLFFYLKEKLTFSETFLGTLASLTWIGAILGCFFYSRFFKDIPLKRTLKWAIIINFFNTFFCILILNNISAFILFLVGGFFGYISFLPIMAVSAKLTNGTGVEGSLFAILMSVHNLGTVLSTFVGGHLFEVIGLRLLIILTAFTGLFALYFVRKLKLA